MMQQSAIPTALQALLVLKKEASPVAPGPGGQPIPTVAAQTAQQMMQPPQTQMGPQMPQGTLPGAAQNAGLGNAIEMQQQQAAQKALMDQMLAQQQQQQQQPVMAAHGGLMSLPVSNMDSFAEGGVVGYNGTDTSEVNLGGVSGIPYYQPGPSEERERLNQLPMDAAIALWELIKQGGAKLVEGTTMDPNYNKPKPPPPEPVPATLGGETPTGGGLTTEAARGRSPTTAKAAETKQSVPAPRSAAGVASLPGAKSGYSVQQLMESALAPVNAALSGYQLPEVRSQEEITRARRAALSKEGLPEKPMSAEEQGLAELRRQNEAIRAFQEQMLAKKEAALGSPGEQQMNRFMEAIRYGAQGGKGSFAQGLQNAILAERQSAEARDAERLKMLETGRSEAIEYTRIQGLVDAARRAEIVGDFDKAQQLKDAAQAAANALVMARAKAAEQVGPSAITAFGHMSVEAQRAAREAAKEKDPGGIFALHERLFPGKPMTLESLTQIKKALNPAIDERASAAQAQNALKRQELRQKDMIYVGLEMQLMNEKDPAEINRIKARMAERERGAGIFDDSAASGSKFVYDPATGQIVPSR